jgi:hypothetical protein
MISIRENCIENMNINSFGFFVNSIKISSIGGNQTMFADLVLKDLTTANTENEILKSQSMNQPIEFISRSSEPECEGLRKAAESFTENFFK